MLSEILFNNLKQMYLISENFKKWRLGGKYLCNVYYIANLKSRPADITDQVAEKFDFKYNKWCIEIPHWCGTWYMRIREAIEHNEWWLAIFNISCFRN